ncbi:MAG: site-2 protease family protein [Anaerolineae bacterium]|nr:site-2 protease family protein [Anaerolineae bacterium]
MSDDGKGMSLGRFGQQPGDHAMPPDSAVKAMRQAAAEVMDIQDVTMGDARSPLRIRGTLTLPSDEAFARLRPQFEAVGHTPMLRRENGMDVIRALPVVYSKEHTGPPRAAIIMLILTIFSVLYVGIMQSDELFIDPLTVLAVQITGDTSLTSYPDLIPTPEVWRSALVTGALFTLAMLGILGTHEMGHYLMSRRHKVQTTLPFFIPMPLSILGTLGAVIAMKEPAPNRRVQFDIGIAGPLAGLIVAIPVMVLGLTFSQVQPITEFLSTVPDSMRDNIVIFQEGQSLLYIGLKYLVFGRVLPNGNLDVWIHPVAFAAWAGLLVTALNLLPIGQLDGGHVLYGLFGEKMQKLRRPIIGLLVLLAAAGTLSEIGVIDITFGWSGWWLWVAIMVFLLRGHAPVLDEITELDGKRKALGIVMLIIFVLIFTPTPIKISEIPTALLFHWPMV